MSLTQEVRLRPEALIFVGGIPTAVDRNEDAGFPEFNKLPQRSTTSRYLFETKRDENGRLTAEAGNRLGRRGSGVQIAPPRPMALFDRETNSTHRDRGQTADGSMAAGEVARFL